MNKIAMHFTLFIVLLSALNSEARKSRIHHGKYTALRPDTQGDSYKKQGLGAPFDNDESLGGEPVGNIDNLGGLGNEMHGFPIGMGAGGEPLGAFEREDEPTRFQQEVGMQQGLDEGGPFGGGIAFGFSRNNPSTGFNNRDGNYQSNWDYFEGRQSMESGPRNVRPGLFGPASEGPGENVLGTEQMQMQGFLNPPAAMSESMSNSIENIGMDKANIQGDSEVGEMVRARGAPTSRYFEPSVPDQNGLPFNDINRNPFDAPEEYKNIKSDLLGIENMRRASPEEIVGSKRLLKNRHGSKRRLVKIKRKPHKWEGFNSLKQQGFKTLQS